MIKRFLNNTAKLQEQKERLVFDVKTDLVNTQSNGLIEYNTKKPKITQKRNLKQVARKRDQTEHAIKCLLKRSKGASDREHIKNKQALQDRKMERQYIEHTLQQYDISISDSTIAIIDVFENISLLYKQFTHCTSWDDIMCCVLTFVKLTTKKTFFEHGLALGKALHTVTNSFDVDYIREIMGVEVLQADSWIEGARHMVDNYAVFKGTELFQKFHKLLLYLLGTQLLEIPESSRIKPLFKGIETEAKRSGVTLGFDFVHMICDTVVFILERCSQFIKTGEWSEILHTGDRYLQWFNQTRVLQSQSKLLQNAQIHNIDIAKYRYELDKCIMQGHHMYKVAIGQGDERYKIITSICSQLEYLRATDLNHQTAQNARASPFSILVSGQSSINKSGFTRILYYEYAKHMGLEYIDEDGRANHLYVRTATDQYWSGFKSSHWALLFDDVAYMNPNAANGLDPTISDIIQVVNNVPFVPPQAELENKGNIPVLCNWVCATTNIEHMNAQAYFAFPLAFKRRFPYVIEIRIKPEYESSGGMADSSKIPRVGEYQGYLNIWNIIVKKVSPIKVKGVQDGVLYRHREYSDIHEFLIWYRSIIDAHNKSQSSYSETDKHFADVRLCKQCGYPSCECAPHELQSQEGYEYNGGFVFAQDRKYVYYRVRDNNWLKFTFNGPDLSDGDLVVLPESLVEFAQIPPALPPSDLTNMISDSLVKIPDLKANTTLAYPSREIKARFWQTPCGYIPIIRHPCAINLSEVVTLTKIPRAIYDYITCEWSIVDGDLEVHHGVTLNDLLSLFIANSENISCDLPENFKNIMDLSQGGTSAESPTHAELYADCLENYIDSRPDSTWFSWIIAFFMSLFFEYTWIRWACGKLYAFYFVRVFFTRFILKRFINPKLIGLLIQRLGDRACKATGLSARTLKFIAGASAATGAMFLVYKAVSHILPKTSTEDDEELQGNVMTMGVTPVGNDSEENVWVKKDFTLSSFDVSGPTKSWKSFTPEKVCTLLSSNLVRLLIRYETADGVKRIRTTCAICLKGNIYILNTHAVPESDEFVVELIQSNVEDGVTPNTSFLMKRTQFHVNEKDDLCVVEFSALPPKKDITALVASDTVRGTFDGIYITRTDRGAVEMITLYSCGYTPNRTHGSIRKTFPTIEGYTDIPTKYGDCGSMLVALTPLGPVIWGLHMSGAYDSVNSAALTHSIVREKLSVVTTLQVLDGIPSLHSDNHGKTLQALHPKATVRWLRQGSMSVFGSLDGHRSHPKSKVASTFIAPALAKRGITTDCGAPVMSGWEVFHNGLKNIPKVHDNYDEPALRQCMLHFVDKVFDEIPVDILKKEVKVYSLKASINGIPGVKFIDSINKNTSAGFPYTQCKRAFIVEQPADDIWSSPITFTPEILKRVQEIEDCYSRGERWLPVFTASLKDEVRARKKIEAKMTRMFMGGPVDWCLYVRMQLLWLVRLMQLNPSVFECMVGIDVHSRQWHDFAAQVAEAFNIFCGDFAQFDTSMQARLIMMVGEFCIEIMRRLGCSESDMLKVKCIFADMAFALVNYFNDLYMFHGVNPSGNPITVLINCIVVSLLFRYSFRCRRPLSEFKHVTLFTYGDDNVCLVSRGYEWFNLLHVQTVLKTVGVTYTMAEKDATPTEFVSLDEVSFLKRTIKYDADLDSFVGPLDEASIRKSCLLAVTSTTLSTREHALEIVKGVMREYFFYGREVYLEKKEFFHSILCESGITHYRYEDVFPLWEILALRYFTSSYKKGLISQVQFETKSEYWRSVTALLSPDPIERSDAWELQSSDRPSSEEFLNSRSTLLRYLDLHIREHEPYSYATISRFAQTLKENYEREQFAHLRTGRSPIRRSLGYYLDEARAILNESWEEAMEHYVDATPRCKLAIIRAEMTYAAYQFQMAFYRCYRDELELQSADVTAEEYERTGAASTEQNVEFLDEMEGMSSGYSPSVPMANMCEANLADGGLGEFLSRPVRIGNFTWLEADPVGSLRVFNPWHLFFNDARIKYKLNNYAFVSCNLHVKVLINASPFYYGAMFMNYTPYSTQSPAIILDATNQYLIPYSQRPHMWIYPQMNQGGEMTLPYFNVKKWLNLQSSADMTNMGKLAFVNYTQLQSANGVSGSGVTVQIFAWATEVKLSGPSVGLAMQSKDMKADEYNKGPVSSVATAVSRFAGNFTSVPVISQLATATQMGARALAMGASFFGFSNPPVIANTTPMRPSAFPQLASTELSYPVEKLTVDPKNELTVDPSVLGLPSVDELNLTYLNGRESFLCTANWSSTNNVDDILFRSACTPGLFGADSLTFTKIQMTPMCWASQMFRHWRGDIIFRFRFVATQYHKGRVRIHFDPSGVPGNNVVSDPIASTVTYTKVIDIGKDTDVELRIPYNQALGWLRTLVPNSANTCWSTSSSPTFNYDRDFFNGTVIMRVLTTLTAPTAVSDISVMVFVRGAENLEYANPQAIGDGLDTWSWMQPQSADYLDDNGMVETRTIAGSTSKQDHSLYLTNFGERIVSARQILRRSTLSRVQMIPDSVETNILFRQDMGRLPLQPGYDPNGWDTANKQLTVGTTKYNFVHMTPLNWLSPAFMATRGSVMWHFNVVGDSAIGHIRFHRLPNFNTTTGVSITGFSPANYSQAAAWYTANTGSGASGQSVTNQITNAGLSVEFPMYSNYKFQQTVPTNASQLGVAFDGSGYGAGRLEIALTQTAKSTAGSLRVWEYVSAGTDFSLSFFIGVPTLCIYTTVPVAP